MRGILLAAVCALLAASLASASPALGLPSAPATTFKDSNTCTCHGQMVYAWSQSMHAQALSDPLYRAKVAEANKATNGTLGAFCVTCHGPVARMMGAVRSGPSVPMPANAAQGVSCDFCHQAVDATSPLGNTSFDAQADGTTKRAQYADAASPAHRTAYSEFHETAEFCGSCHDVDHPANGMHLESAYSEWKAGPYAAQGIVCQDCHMTPSPGVTKPNPGKAAAIGPDRDMLYEMTWVGGNVALGPKALAQERLQAAATLEFQPPSVMAPGTTLNVKTTITNVGAGHYLPTGLTEVRRMWLEVTATDRNGKKTVVGRRDFGTQLKDKAGRSPVELWDAVGIARDDRIAPKRSVTQKYSFKMVDQGPVILESALYYRSVSEELAKKAGVAVPTTTMAKVTKTVYGTQAAADAAPIAGVDPVSEPRSFSVLWLGAVGTLGAFGAVGSFVRRQARV